MENLSLPEKTGIGDSRALKMMVMDMKRYGGTGKKRVGREADGHPHERVTWNLKRSAYRSSKALAPSSPYFSLGPVYSVEITGEDGETGKGRMSQNPRAGKDSRDHVWEVSGVRTRDCTPRMKLGKRVKCVAGEVLESPRSGRSSLTQWMQSSEKVCTIGQSSPLLKRARRRSGR